jgi:hypothetical protein
MLESLSKKASFKKIFQVVILLSLSAFLVTAPGLSASAQTVHEPARGTPERSDILNTVRPMVEARLGPPVEFVVDWMRSGYGWAFVHLSPQRPGGGAIDISRTTFAGQAEFMGGLDTYALLRFQYNRWNLIDFVVGPTDVFWHGDPLYAQLPPGLTPY